MLFDGAASSFQKRSSLVSHESVLLSEESNATELLAVAKFDTFASSVFLHLDW